MAVCRDDSFSILSMIELSRRFSNGLWNCIQVSYLFSICSPTIFNFTDFNSMYASVLGVLWMYPSSYEHDLRVFSTPTDFNTIHVRLFNVRHCAADFNHIG